ncbi:MAG: MoaD/ThiS family protein [bacterium]|nr:MoaD/ThiS family protein [bacterium]
MKLRLFAFAGLKELIGAQELALELPAGATVQMALDQLMADYPAVTSIAPSLSAAIDQEYAPLDAVLSEGCELALFPPVGGG